MALQTIVHDYNLLMLHSYHAVQLDHAHLTLADAENSDHSCSAERQCHEQHLIAQHRT
jgi:hypothetical protein